MKSAKIFSVFCISLFLFTVDYLSAGLFYKGILKNDTLISNFSEIKEIDLMPEFPGGEEALFEYLKTSIKYPHKANVKQIEGRVIAEFIVDRNGGIKNPTIIWGISPELDKEALRVIMLMPNWTPGVQDGKKINVKYTLPISFILQSDTKKHKQEQPEFPGGHKELVKYLHENRRYPASYQKTARNKMAFVQFLVSKKGKIKNASILASTRIPELDEEALRLIRNMPDWTPAKIDGKKSFVRCVLPVYFD